MPYKDILAPASAEYLTKLFQAVFTPCRIGQSVNIITFAGAGKWANLNFISDYAKEFDPTYPPTAYIFLNAQQLAFSVTEELNNGISFMFARASAQKNEVVADIASQSTKNDSVLDFMNTLKLLNEQGQRVVLFVDGADFLAQKDRKAQLAVATLTTIEQMHTARMSFVFITKSELPNDISHLGRLEKYFTQHVVTESDVPHDEECVAAYLIRFEKTRNVSFSSIAKTRLASFAKGMPIISKHFIEKYHTDELLRALLDAPNYDISQIYRTDEAYLDAYFEGLLYRLSPQSKDFLFGISSVPTSYLKAAGIIDESGAPINEVFTYYLQNRGQRFGISTGIESLSAQEQRVFQLLIDSLGNIVSREELARTLWQDQWQAKYSEQAIDKVISNIRAKITNSQYKISAVKGVGVIAEKL